MKAEDIVDPEDMKRKKDFKMVNNTLERYYKAIEKRDNIMD